MRIVNLSVGIALILTPAAAYADTTHQGNADMFKTLFSKIGLRSEGQPMPAAPPETLAQLRDAVAARLRSEAAVEEVAVDPGNPAVLRVRLANRGSEAVTGTVDVTNVYGRLYTLRNDLDREAAIENLVQSVLVTVRRSELDLRHVSPMSGSGSQGMSRMRQRPWRRSLPATWRLSCSWTRRKAWSGSRAPISASAPSPSSARPRRGIFCGKCQNSRKNGSTIT
ncbi:hypothetical protein U8P73_14665 [Rhizobium beringeri]|jgi:hypothetical protein|uniref:hypothetical protein n=1 Tax=Rhizobium TaxID=379 RepID=UPI001F3C5E8A|nr:MULTISPECIES: hypothetical protein [Rhizobium]UIJ78086.1 hypothetical protein LZK78_14850 [Rhizobium leguminosarum]WSG87297.1 hypothetical protein U8P73_14665 [Rhizobium beringeri]